MMIFKKDKRAETGLSAAGGPCTSTRCANLMWGRQQGHFAAKWTPKPSQRVRRGPESDAFCGATIVRPQWRRKPTMAAADPAATGAGRAGNLGLGLPEGKYSSAQERHLHGLFSNFRFSERVSARLSAVRPDPSGPVSPGRRQCYVKGWALRYAAAKLKTNRTTTQYTTYDVSPKQHTGLIYLICKVQKFRQQATQDEQVSSSSMPRDEMAAHCPSFRSPRHSRPGPRDGTRS